MIRDNHENGIVNLAQIPVECIQASMLFLSLRDLCSFIVVSKLFYSISMTNTLWHSLYFRKWPSRLNRQGRRSVVPIGTDDWRSRFRSKLICDTEATSVQTDWKVFEEAVVPRMNPINHDLPSENLRDEPTHSPHTCSPRSCLFIQIGQNAFKCESSGKVHECEACRDSFACSSSIESLGDSLWVCPISARTFSNPPFTFMDDPTSKLERDSESDSSSYPSCRLDQRVLKRQRRGQKRFPS